MAVDQTILDARIATIANLKTETTAKIHSKVSEMKQINTGLGRVGLAEMRINDSFIQKCVEVCNTAENSINNAETIDDINAVVVGAWPVYTSIDDLDPLI